MAFYFWTKPFGACKNHLKNGFFYFWGRAFGHFKNTIKIKGICPKKLLKLLKKRSKFVIFRYPKMAFH
jgi:hypothetical protein